MRNRRPMLGGYTLRLISVLFTGLMALAIGFLAVELRLGTGTASAEAWQYGREKAMPQGCVGSWSVVSSPNPDATSNRLSSIDVVSANDIWAVGYTRISGVRSTLTVHWDGTQWSYVPSPNSGTNANQLVSVAAYSTLDVWAVGNYQEGAYQRTLIEHWNGLQWSIVPSPNYGSNDNFLTSVDVRAPNDAWAVGYYVTNNGSTRGVVSERWDGLQWTFMGGLNYPGADTTQFSAVAIAGPNDVWAVGWLTWAGAYTIIEHWDGTEWSIVPSPNPGPIDTYLSALAVISPTDIWAVGYRVDVQGFLIDRTFTVHWDGTQWSWIDSPSIANRYSRFISVSAVSSDDVWAVGFDGNPDMSTFVEHWDGTSWSIIASPDPSASQNRLLGVAAVASDDVWAVGYYIASAGLTLVERYSVQCGTASPTVPLPITPTETVQPAATRTATATLTATSMPSNTATATATNTATSTATNTPLPTQTHGDPSATPTPSNTPIPPTSTSTRTNTQIPPAGTATGTPTPPSPSPTSCTLTFTDVPVDSTFYPFIHCLACRSIISGYQCGGEGEPCGQENSPYYRPSVNVTRGQIAKIVSNSAGYDEDPDPQIYEDVDPSNTFYQWVNRLSRRGHMGGYPCWTVPEEPCNPPDDRPYFRPFNNATRGQLAKIVSNAAGFDDTPPDQIFADVLPENGFYLWIERLASRGIMGGYPCGGEGEPCDDQNRPYFRPFNNVTRGQTSKIVSGAFFPNCQARTR